MGKKKKQLTGVGSDCPPLKGHLEIYFLQKGRPTQDAHSFFQHHEHLGWKIRDWKAAAFRWMIKRPLPIGTLIEKR